jgi:WD40 repeat protein
MQVLTTRKQKLDPVTFSAESTRLAAAGQDGAYLWTLADPAEPRVIGRGVTSGIGFVTGRDCLVVSTGLGGSVVHSLSEGADHVIDIRYPVRVVTPCPTRPLVLLSQTMFGRVACVELTAGGTGRVKWARETKPVVSSSNPVFGPDGDWFARVSADGGWYLSVTWTTTGKQQRVVDLEDAALTPPAADPTADRLVQYDAGKLIVSELSGDPFASQQIVASGGRKHFTGVAFHPSGRYLAATSNDETVKLYDTATWQLARTFTWQVGRLRSVAFSPDGTRAAVGSDTGQVVVWDVDL